MAGPAVPVSYTHLDVYKRQPYENAVTFQFGDSPELADELLALVLAGAKTATCGALRDFDEKEPVPEPGRRDVVLDGRGRPACAIETLSIVIQRFDEVDEAFAVAEGEGPYDCLLYTSRCV